MEGARGLRIGIIASRLGGTDGVSMEVEAWSRVLRGLGHEVWSFAGLFETPVQRSTVAPLAFFGHPAVEDLTAGIFGGKAAETSSSRELLGGVALLKAVDAMVRDLESELRAFVRACDPQLLIAENTLSLPVHVPLGIALTRLAADTAIPVLAHHHDLPWERERFALTAYRELIEEAFPPKLASVHHVCINSQQQAELEWRTGRTPRVIPNTIELGDVPEPPPDIRAELGLDPDELLILQPTRVVPRKGIEHALELIRRLDRPARLVVSGAWGDEGLAYGRHVDALAGLLGVSVTWASDHFADQRGRAPDGRPVYSVDDAFQAADLVTYPSAVEGFGRALLASVRNRRPLVVNRYPIYDLDIRPLGFKAVEMDGFVGEATVEMTRTVLDDPALQAEWADSNYRLVERHFSLDVLWGALAEALGEVVS